MYRMITGGGGPSFFATTLSGEALQDHLEDLSKRYGEAYQFLEYKLQKMKEVSAVDATEIIETQENMRLCKHFSAGYKKTADLLTPHETYQLSLLDLDTLGLVQGPYSLLEQVEHEKDSPFLDV